MKQYCRYCSFCFEADDFRCSNHPSGKQVNCLEEYYDISHPNLLPAEFKGCFFNFVNEDEFAEYLNKRYGYKIVTEVIEKYWLQIKD